MILIKSVLYSCRHSRFGGTYIVQNMKAIGENQLICHKPYQKIEALEFGTEKVWKKERERKKGILSYKEMKSFAFNIFFSLNDYIRDDREGGGKGGGWVYSIRRAIFAISFISGWKIFKKMYDC